MNLASLSANIVEVIHDRLSSNVRCWNNWCNIKLRNRRSKTHVDDLIQHLKEKTHRF